MATIAVITANAAGVAVTHTVPVKVGESSQAFQYAANGIRFDLRVSFFESPEPTGE